MDMNGMEFGLTTLVRLKLRVSAKYQKQHQNLNQACTGKTNQIMVGEILLALAKELAVSLKYCQNLTKYIPDVVLFCISSSNKDFTKVCKIRCFPHYLTTYIFEQEVGKTEILILGKRYLSFLFLQPFHEKQ